MRAGGASFQTLVVKGRRFDAEHLVKLRARRRVLQEDALFGEDVVAGREGCERAFMEARENELLLSGVRIDVAHGEDAGDARLEAGGVDDDLLALEVEPPVFDGAELGLKAEEDEEVVERDAARNATSVSLPSSSVKPVTWPTSNCISQFSQSSFMRATEAACARKPSRR